jgi:hypothetical protein
MIFCSSFQPVMAGLDPAIQEPSFRLQGIVWMPGSRPDMTARAMTEAK